MGYKVAVLGCGPAGLLAAHACARAGVEFDIISKKTPSKIGGAQFLHVPIQGLTSQTCDGIVKFYKHGRKEIYASKVYGDPEAPTSWDAYETGPHDVWNLQAAYEALWLAYSGSIKDQVVSPAEVMSCIWEYDAVFSTIPKVALCLHGHDFSMQPVWIDMNPLEKIEESAVIYSGMRSDVWYRASNIFGHSSLEFPDQPEYPGKIVRISKPLTNNCDCWAPFPDLHFFGRYGEWRKAVLTHDAYYGAINTLNGVLHGAES